MRRKFQELNLKDAFLFAAAMQDEEICRTILEVILEKPVDKISVHTEHSLLFSSDFRSIRLDVYVRDGLQVEYNLEMQNEDRKNLARRSRYHQAEMDVASLKPGEDFSDLKPGYVIFICTYDPFDRHMYRYTFENRCLEQDFPLGDETKKIFLSTKGENEEEVPSVLVNFLRYVENSTDEYAETVNDAAVQMLHRKVTQLKKSREWEGRYMKFEELLLESEEKGREEGRQEGKADMLNLVSHMMESGEAEKVSHLKDPHFYEEMCRKYNL